MIRYIDPATLRKKSVKPPLVDVRSPGEYNQGHIPGAHNIPLFSDEERKEIGTLYHRRGPDEAILKGLDVALPKTADYIGRLKEISDGKEVLLYCWRGGSRSASMAQVLNSAGYNVEVIEGGYKAWRRYLRNGLAEPLKVFILGGFTGSGKTELLQVIKDLGEQVVDLEALACHRGSAFGALGQEKQPTNEQFENELFAVIDLFDKERPVWMEDESRMIGKITLPDSVTEKIRSGMLVLVEAGKQERIARLVREYAGFDTRLLAESINRIREQLGGGRTRDALQALSRGDFSSVAGIVLDYYDKAYSHTLERRKDPPYLRFVIEDKDITANAATIIRHVY